jgi:signal transduction histidine kinase/CheY-like chemotaxis protein
VTDSGLSRLGRWYVGLVVAAGLLLLAWSLAYLVTGRLDPRWLVFAAFTVLSASATIKVPALPARISVSETFVFTSLLVFGPEAGALTVAIDGLVASLWIHRRKSYAVYKTLFNMTAPALSLWVAWRLAFGLAGVAPLVVHATAIDHLLPPLFVLAALYFALNSWLIAVAIGIQTRVRPVDVWSGSFLWVAINYLGGASVSVLLILLYESPVVSTVAVGITVPLLTIFYLMFKIGMGRVEDSIAHLTALKLAADERAGLEEQLREAHKMDAVGRLAGGFAHDLNNLLTPILGYADVLLEDAGPDDRRRDELLQIRHAAERARDLTGQLLAFGRRQILTLRLVDLGAVVAGFDRVLRRMVREDVRVEVHGPTSLGLVRADAGQLEQVLMNLVVNAQDAMPDGGTLTISVAETVVDDARVAIDPGLPLGRCVTLTVRDTGVGMDADTVSRICEPFFTTKDRGRSPGLGLSTVFGIVKQHGGHLTVASSPGAGSAFTVYLPVTEERDADEPGDAQARPADAGLTRASILVVEDNEAVGRMTRVMLEREGYRVVLAATGQAALELTGTLASSFELLVTDVALPDVNGSELYGRMHDRQPGLKVLYMSGYAEELINDSRGLPAGTHFLQKPFSAKTLARKVREALGGVAPAS